MAGKPDDGKRPIIIKKIKKAGHGHHGGAWKVAYADFVTAMMAFFLLLWLLSTSSKSKLEGLAEFFTPTQGLKDGMGIGFKGGTGNSETGAAKDKTNSPGLITGRTPSGVIPDNPDNAKVDGDQDANLFKQGATAIEQTFAQDSTLKQYQDNISVTQTPEGLRIDVMDSDKFSMFEPATARLTEHGQAILSKIASLVKKMPNYLSIAGHTDASPAETGRSDYTNWELSSDRAQTARRFLTKSGLEAERSKKVIGLADKELMTPREPRGPKNRRVAITLLRGSHILIPDAAVPDAAPAIAISTEPVAAPAEKPVSPAEPTASDGHAAAPATAAH